MTGYRVGIDIGGTFTDIVLLRDDGRLFGRKVSSSTANYAQAIADGLIAALSDVGLEAGEIVEVLHGTTAASNAILEHKGARTGLVTTRGFRDVLEIRNLRRPGLYDMDWEKPPTLVERYLRFEVDERVTAGGLVDRELDLRQVEAAVDRLVGEGVEAIAVCLLHSYANPAHERRIAEVIRARAPGIACSLSSDVLPEIKEYERTSTTVINAYVKPIVGRYLESLIEKLREIGVGAPLFLMQSNGGVTTAEAAVEKPVNIVESGPAAGVIGAQALGRRIGLADIISFDMGGTTAKASLIENGSLTRADDYAVGGGIMIGSRLMTGAGYVLKVPAVDLAEVGAGGGSLIWIDSGGVPQVGPKSAGSTPGPACYGLGTTAPTITDANVVLGYINPDYLAGGEVRLQPELSREALRTRVAEPLGLPLEKAAYGAHLVATSNMVRAIKAVSSERGRDPRRYCLVAFGGNGPLFACGIAAALKIKRVLVPPFAGVFSACGLLYAEVEYHFSLSCGRRNAAPDLAALNGAWAGLEADGRKRLALDGYPPERMLFRRFAKIHYRGQGYDLTVPAPAGPLTDDGLRALEEAFAQQHLQTYGHRASRDEPVEIVTINVLASAIPDPGRSPRQIVPAADDGKALPPRQAYFGPSLGWMTTQVLRRPDLAERRAGPCIVEEYDATCVIPPGAQAQLDAVGNIGIDLQQQVASP